MRAAICPREELVHQGFPNIQRWRRPSSFRHSSGTSRETRTAARTRAGRPNWLIPRKDQSLRLAFRCETSACSPLWPPWGTIQAHGQALGMSVVSSQVFGAASWAHTTPPTQATSSGRMAPSFVSTLGGKLSNPAPIKVALGNAGLASTVSATSPQEALRQCRHTRRGENCAESNSAHQREHHV